MAPALCLTADRIAVGSAVLHGSPAHGSVQQTDRQTDNTPRLRHDVYSRLYDPSSTGAAM